MADTLGVKIYSALTLSDIIDKNSVFYYYKDKYYFVQKSPFRKIERSIRKVLDKIPFDEKISKDVIKDILNL